MKSSSSALRAMLLPTAAIVLGIAALIQTAQVHVAMSHSRMILAPMIGVIEPCILLQESVSPDLDGGLAKSCLAPQGSAAQLIESTLSGISSGRGRDDFELGYTLPVPLLQLFKRIGSDWVIDREIVNRLVRTIRDTDRPAVVYLFSTHFATGAPIEKELSEDVTNLSETPQGPLPASTYYSAPIYNWTFANPHTDITARRLQAVRAVVEEICRLEPSQISKIRAVTLLGETHQLFPDFQSGMGFAPPYRVTDYSTTSRSGFRDFLRRKFGEISHMNRMLDTSWTSFNEVEPPSKDVRVERLRDFTEHIDSFAHGSLPIAGWAHLSAAGAAPSWVRIYRNGELVGRTAVELGRQDVLQALPELGDANPGWRYDMDFKTLPRGLHKIDVMLEMGDGRLALLASRQIAIMGRNQEAPLPMPQKPLPASSEPGAGVKAHVDQPVDQASYFYNPLVPLWHAYRQQQVVQYLELFGDVVNASCLAQTNLYTHQIIPFTNPSWDANKFAIGASLEKLKGIRLGVSLYGEATYGRNFSDWLAAGSHHTYGITEFHPLKAMPPDDLRKVLERHSQQGAEFTSFFLEPRWNGSLVPRGHNIFSFDPDNSKFGSNQLFQSIKDANTKMP